MQSDRDNFEKIEAKKKLGEVESELAKHRDKKVEWQNKEKEYLKTISQLED